MWFRNGIQKIPSPVASCEAAFFVLNTEHVCSFLGPHCCICQLGQAEFLPLEVFGQDTNRMFQYHIAVRDSLFLLNYQFLLISPTNYSGKARRKRAAGAPTALVCTVGCSEFHPHRGSKWTRHLRWGFQNSAGNCQWDGENYSAALTRYSWYSPFALSENFSLFLHIFLIPSLVVNECIWD